MSYTKAGSTSLLAAIMGVQLLFAQSSTPDLVIVNARIHTVNPAIPTAEAVAIAAGQFTAVGTSREIHALAGPKARILDAAGTSFRFLQDNHLCSASAGNGKGVQPLR